MLTWSLRPFFDCAPTATVTECVFQQEFEEAGRLPLTSTIPAGLIAGIRLDAVLSEVGQLKITMNRALQEHIEAKVINLLHDVKTPIHASQIAVHIQEREDDTNQAVQRLVRNKTIHGVQDFACFKSTGETMAYVLAEAWLKHPTIDPSIPAAPPALTPRAGAGRTYH